MPSSWSRDPQPKHTTNIRYKNYSTKCCVCCYVGKPYSDYPEIDITEHEYVHIWGVVTYVIHKLALEGGSDAWQVHRQAHLPKTAGLRIAQTLIARKH